MNTLEEGARLLSLYLAALDDTGRTRYGPEMLTGIHTARETNG